MAFSTHCQAPARQCPHYSPCSKHCWGAQLYHLPPTTISGSRYSHSRAQPILPCCSEQGWRLLSRATLSLAPHVDHPRQSQVVESHMTVAEQQARTACGNSCHGPCEL